MRDLFPVIKSIPACRFLSGCAQAVPRCSRGHIALLSSRGSTGIDWRRVVGKKMCHNLVMTVFHCHVQELVVGIELQRAMGKQLRNN